MLTATTHRATAKSTFTANPFITISLTSLLKRAEGLSLLPRPCSYGVQPTPLKQGSTSRKCSIFVLNVIKSFRQ